MPCELFLKGTSSLQSASRLSTCLRQPSQLCSALIHIVESKRFTDYVQPEDGNSDSAH